MDHSTYRNSYDFSSIQSLLLLQEYREAYL